MASNVQKRQIMSAFASASPYLHLYLKRLLEQARAKKHEKYWWLDIPSALSGIWKLNFLSKFVKVCCSFGKLILKHSFSCLYRCLENPNLLVKAWRWMTVIVYSPKFKKKDKIRMKHFVFTPKLPVWHGQHKERFDEFLSNTQ